MTDQIKIVIEYMMEHIFWILLLAGLAAFYALCWHNIKQSNKRKP